MARDGAIPIERGFIVAGRRMKVHDFNFMEQTRFRAVNKTAQYNAETSVTFSSPESTAEALWRTSGAPYSKPPV